MKPLIVEIAPDVKIELLSVQSGKFQMGSNDGGLFEKPVHEVIISKPFWLAATTVTQTQWATMMETNVLDQCRKALHDNTMYDWGTKGWKTIRDLYRVSRDTDPESNDLILGYGDDYPMYWVSWDEALRFCEKLTQIERQAGRLPDGYKYTLPTEAEWEYACRAGTNGDYAGNLDEMAWYQNNGERIAHKVATKKPNAWGFYDMHGNVWEWCEDWFMEYSSENVTDPLIANFGSARVNRGGDYDHPADLCRSAYRDADKPSYRSTLLGFRLALKSIC